MGMIKLYRVEGTMKVKTGLHIGCGDNSSKIGGCDNPVIREKLTNEPYIPGSSLKGCMRNSLESIDANQRKLREDGKTGVLRPCGCGQKTCMICTLFGAHMNTKAECGSPRLRLHDLKLSRDFIDELYDNDKSIDDIIEQRTLTMIDRKTGVAANGSMRNEERIAPNTVFDVEFDIRIDKGDNEKAIIDTLKEAIKLVETNGLGAKTHSGSGTVEFDIDWKHMTNVLD